MLLLELQVHNGIKHLLKLHSVFLICQFLSPVFLLIQSFGRCRCLAIKTKHLRILIWGVVRGFEWVEILNFNVIGIFENTYRLFHQWCPDWNSLETHRSFLQDDWNSLRTHCSWFLKKSALSSWKTSRGGFLVGFYCSILNRLEGILWDQSRMRIQMQLQKIFCPFVKYLFMWSTWKICTCWRWNWIGVKWMRVGYFSSLFVKYSYEIKVFETIRLNLLTFFHTPRILLLNSLNGLKNT